MRELISRPLPSLRQPAVPPDRLTLPLADVLVTKLQVVSINRTIHTTLATLRAQIGEFGLPEDAAATIVAHADELDAALNAAPKSMAWKLRARVAARGGCRKCT